MSENESQQAAKPSELNALLGLLPAGTLIERSFEFDDRTRENIPTITLRLPRCVASDTRPWEERDRLAAALTDLLPNADVNRRLCRPEENHE